MNLEAKEIELITGRTLKEIIESTIEKWLTNYNLIVEKMNAIFQCISAHLEACRSFGDVVRPVEAEYEAKYLTNFDDETRNID